MDLSHEENKKFQNMTINLFQMFDGYMQYLWSALSSLLAEETKKISEDAHKIVAIDIIDFVLKSL